MYPITKLFATASSWSRAQCWEPLDISFEGSKMDRSQNSKQKRSSSFNCIQQILINSLFIFLLLQIFSNFPCYGFLDTFIILKWTFNFQMHGVFKVSWILISHLNAFFSAITVCFLSLLTLLRISTLKSKIPLGKCHIALETMSGIFKYLLILTSNVIPQW